MADTDPPTKIPGAPDPSAAPSGDPESMAGEALKAAQEAVNQIQDQASGAAPDAATAEALAAVQAAIAEAGKPASDPSPAADAEAFTLPSFTEAQTSDKPANLDLLADVNLNVKIELGRTRMYVEDVLRLNEGSVVELDKLAGDPVDIYVNERHVARGEVLVLNDNFCVRVNEIIAPVGQGEAA